MVFTLLGIIFGIIILHLFAINKSRKNFPPGPISLPIIGGLYALGKEPHKQCMKLKLKYGNVIGVDFGGFRAVILNDYNVIKEAFDMPQFLDRPKFEIIAQCRGSSFPGLAWTSKNNWTEQRRFVLKQFGNLGLGTKSMESLLLDQLNILCSYFDSNIGVPVENKQLFEAAAIGALWTIISGTTHDDHDEEINAVVDSVNKMFLATPSTRGVYFFPELSKLFPEMSGRNAFIKANLVQSQFLDQVIKSHRETYDAGQTTPRDYIETYLERIANTTDTNSSFFGEIGIQNLKGTLNDFLRAGTETVATTLTWFIKLLILYPDVQLKLQIEIDKTIGKFTPSLDDRVKLPYVEACILEVMRYSGVLPLALPREVSQDINFKGYFIPKGTIAIPNIYGVLHDSEIWEEPEVFRPERFLSLDGSTVLRNNPSNLVFGSGKRICPGESLARNELFLFITGLLQRYNFSQDPNSPKPTLESKLGLTLDPKPHFMIVSKRDPYMSHLI